MLNDKLLNNMLLCPKSKSALVQAGKRLVCTDSACRLSYHIKDGIPVMLIDAAAELTVKEWEDIIEEHGQIPETGE